MKLAYCPTCGTSTAELGGSHFYLCLFFLHATPTIPTSPEQNNQTAAGTGTAPTPANVSVPSVARSNVPTCEVVDL